MRRQDFLPVSTTQRAKTQLPKGKKGFSLLVRKPTATQREKKTIKTGAERSKKNFQGGSGRRSAKKRIDHIFCGGWRGGDSNFSALLFWPLGLFAYFE